MARLLLQKFRQKINILKDPSMYIIVTHHCSLNAQAEALSQKEDAALLGKLTQLTVSLLKGPSELDGPPVHT